MTERTAGRRRLSVRRIAAVAVAAGIATAAAVAIPMAASASPTQDAAASGFPEARDAAIRPGVQLETPISDTLSEFCTANFVFANGANGGDGSGDKNAKGKNSKGGGGSDGQTGDVYIGTAAHCVADLTSGAGEDADGCNAVTFPEGKEVIITGRDGIEYTATLAYSSWRAMQKNGLNDSNALDLCQYNDFALLKLTPDQVKITNPTVPDFGGPTGLDTDGTKNGDLAVSYQPNILKQTPDKQGFSLGQPTSPLTHIVQTTPPGVSGDSGSGYLGAKGQAFGVLSTQFLDQSGQPLGLNGVTDLANALDYANGEGGLGDVGLVNGTEPFTAVGPSMTLLPPLALLPKQLPTTMHPTVR